MINAETQTIVEINAQALAFIINTHRWDKRNLHHYARGIHLLPNGTLFASDGFMIVLAQNAHNWRGEETLTMMDAPATIKRQTKGNCLYDPSTGVLTTPPGDVYRLPPETGLGHPDFEQVIPNMETAKRWPHRTVGVNLEYVAKLHKAQKAAGISEPAKIDILDGGTVAQFIYQYTLVGYQETPDDVNLLYLLMGTRLS